MNKNINLCELLIGHTGETFYSPLFKGALTLKTVGTDKLVFNHRNGELIYFESDGTYYLNRYSTDECLLFPSEDQRDWDKWAEEQKSKAPKTLKELMETDYYKWSDAIGALSTANTPIEKATLALLNIHQLIEVGYGGNITNEEWNNPHTVKYVIGCQCGIFKTDSVNFKYHIAFHTKEQRDEFFSYPENLQLVKNFYMI